MPPHLSNGLPSLDEASHFVGQLNSDGLSSLRVDTSNSEGMATTSTQSTTLTSELPEGGEESGHTSSSASEEEDYDNLQHDPLTVVTGGKGGGFDEKSDEQDFEIPQPGGVRSRPQPLRIKSIPITLKKSDQKDKYFLIADDVELRRLLKSGVVGENGATPSKRRAKFSDLVFTRQFTTFDRHNLASADSTFHGFFTLFWLGTAIFMIQTAATNWANHGHVFGTNEILQVMLRRDLIILGLSDGVMVAATGFGLMMQKLILNDYISWNKAGWIIQSVWEVLYIGGLVYWTLFRQWPWTHTVFFVLHSLIMLMKQHSYSFYNGHLSEAYKRQKMLLRRLKQLEGFDPAETPSATVLRSDSMSSSYLDERPTSSGHRRRGSVPMAEFQSSDVAKIAAAIESGEPLDLNQIQLFERIIKREVAALTDELQGKATTTKSKSYPNNLTMTNHYEYIVLPTLVYELEYPRSEKIDWYYVVEKATATAGILFIMMLVSQSYIYPVAVRAVEMKNAGLPLQDRLKEFPWMLSDLIFPFMMEYMMVWYIIWECVLNLLAEVTYFADRGFYADWWNSVSWDQFARDWNRPVHNFLLRHVYHSSISSMRISKATATLITFFLSACVHELVMWCLFKKLRGYLLILQMCQLPLVQLSRSRFLKGRSTLGNLIFWIGIFTGPSLLCSLYLVI